MEDKRALTGRREDRRVRRTKHLLEEGLIRLLREKPLKSITVKELTDSIDINRGTFYLYYRDIYDMAEKLENEYFGQFLAMIRTHDGEPVSERIAGIIRDLMAFVEEKQESCRILLDGRAGTEFIRRCEDVIRKTSWEALREEWPLDMARFQYEYAFGVAGLWGIIRAWLDNRCEQPAEEIAQLAYACVCRGVLPSAHLS